MKKKSGYQKLKDRNNELQQHIYAMIMKPNDIDTIFIKTYYLQMFGLEKVIWSGTVPDKDLSKFDGLLNEINKRI